MSLSLHDILKEQIKRMVIGIGPNGNGNIHPLIMNEVERSIIQTVLEETHNNLFRAAKMLGIGRSTLYRKLEVLKIGVPKHSMQHVSEKKSLNNPPDEKF